MQQILLDRVFERTLDVWVAEAATLPRSTRLEAWLFDGETVRRQAERRLKAAGVEARIRSAYKPLLHHVLEELDATGVARAVVHYPVYAGLPADRYRLEAYPLHAVLPGVALSFEPFDAAAAAPPAYRLALRWHDGRAQEQTVEAPTRFDPLPHGQLSASPTAWRRIVGPGGRTLRDGAEPSDYAAVFDAAMSAIHQHPWPASEPYFGRLRIDVALPAAMPEDRAAPFADLLEAMHEELYFASLEFFQRHTGRPAGDRHLKPGQIAPFVRPIARADTGPIALRIALENGPVDAAPSAVPALKEPASLDAAERPLSPARIEHELARLGGTRFEAETAQGRRTVALHWRGTTPPVLLSGGQHANETSGVVGALRAAQRLRERGDIDLALIALENPDGYALHQALCAIAPTQMHHAARYSALGDDIGHRDRAPLGERQARNWALTESGAQLHLNLHGYPAHEWTRPLSGYIPQGFADWTIPKGFFLILRHHAGWQARGRELVQTVCAALAGQTALREFNAQQIEAHQRYRAQALPFELIDGFLCSITEAADGPPLTLTTEFPDQTLNGPAFTFACDTQCAAVLAAVEAYLALQPRWAERGTA